MLSKVNGATTMDGYSISVEQNNIVKCETIVERKEIAFYDINLLDEKTVCVCVFRARKKGPEQRDFCIQC